MNQRSVQEILLKPGTTTIPVECTGMMLPMNYYWKQAQEYPMRCVGAYTCL